ncbi:hypothetical protein SCHPADRAFT_120477 [Schizopora paradoxa]|uniref:F-box domain-containing protein n=1 Tax=Schizopora paradoxa TaxID=27342 RepID=A0A0H2SN77_9AGAM|nr:hypothetical protein SCHPADRAFT_120477 [Schizopora paradoxa]
MSSRKRRKETRSDALDAPVVPDTTNSEEDISERRPAKRRQKLSAQSTVPFLLEMPTEIITEIASFAHPGDLLNLARTSVGLRELLMAKSSQCVWESARRIHGLPDCPSDLSEPQLADLLFGRGCSFCSETRARKLIVEWRVRVCKECLENHFAIIEHELEERKTSLPAHVDIYAMIPNLQGTKFGRPMSKTVGIQLKQVLDQVDELRSSPKRLEEYVEERKKLTEACYESTRMIESWLHDSSSQKERSNIILKEERRKAIMQKLEELGYVDEDLSSRYDYKFNLPGKEWKKWKQLLDQTRPLTERVWQNIKPQLEEIIGLRRQHLGQHFQQKRRETRQEEMRKRFVEHQPQLQNAPNVNLFQPSDVLEIPIVKILVEEDECKVPLTDERWNRVTNVLFEEVSKQLKKIERDCLKTIKVAIEEVSKTNDRRLHFWDDKNDQKDIVPAQFLSATSLFDSRYSYPGQYCSYSEILFYRTQPRSYWAAWNKANFTSGRKIITTAFRLLKLLGLPPETTMAYMLSCGATFKCEQCFYGEGALAMSWSSLVR